MASVNISIIPGSPYIWSNANFAWDSPTSLNIWDNIAPTIYALTINEDAVAVSDQIRKLADKRSCEVITMGDGNSILGIAKVLKESVGISELYVDYITFLLRVCEAINIVETPKKTIALLKNDGFSFSDKDLKNVTILESETVSVSDKKVTAISAVCKEVINVMELARKAIAALKGEILSIAETKMLKNIMKINIETLNFAETYADMIGFILKINETVIFSETPIKIPAILKTEEFTTIDKQWAKPTKKLLETVGVAESRTDEKTFIRAFNEAIAFLEKNMKSCSLKKYEVFDLVDDIIRNANAVISDLSILDEDLTLEEFIARTSSPEGYSAFKDFIVGDHNYQKALIRTVVETFAIGGRPCLDKWVLNVDVPDAIDSGTVDVGASLTTVNFNRRFNAPPEVQVTLRGGTRGIPCVVNIYEDHFEIEIVNASNVNVAGAVSWTAKGY